MAGDSAGGHLAATTGLMAPPEARASAMILYNPVIDTASEDGWAMKGYTQAERVALSPAHHVATGAPPTLLLHGTADRVVPIRWVERFVEAMEKVDNAIRFERLEGVGHAFIIPGYGSSAEIDAAIQATDSFLQALGYME